MTAISTRILEGTIDRLVRWIVLPVTGVIPFLVSSGILLVTYAGIWLAFGAALAADQGAIGDAWRWIGALPLPLAGLTWLLFLPPMAGLWIWGTDWPLAVRLVLVAGLAAWNLLVFIPRREAAPADQPAAHS